MGRRRHALANACIHPRWSMPRRCGAHGVCVRGRGQSGSADALGHTAKAPFEAGRAAAGDRHRAKPIPGPLPWTAQRLPPRESTRARAARGPGAVRRRSATVGTRWGPHCHSSCPPSPTSAGCLPSPAQLSVKPCTECTTLGAAARTVGAPWIRPSHGRTSPLKPPSFPRPYAHAVSDPASSPKCPLSLQTHAAACRRGPRTVSSTSRPANSSSTRSTPGNRLKGPPGGAKSAELSRHANGGLAASPLAPANAGGATAISRVTPPPFLHGMRRKPAEGRGVTSIFLECAPQSDMARQVYRESPKRRTRPLSVECAVRNNLRFSGAPLGCTTRAHWRRLSGCPLAPVARG